MFVCQECHKTFTSKNACNYHIENKVCQKHIHKCSHCCQVFKCKKGLKYHIDHNVCANLPQSERVIAPTYDNMSRQELIIKVAHLEGENQALKEHPQSINQNINQNIVVFPTAFGKEDMDHIRQKLGDIIEPLISNHVFQSIPNLFNAIHNNDKLPEYHNVYINSERSGYALVSDGHGFKHKLKNTIIDQIIEDKRSILNAYVDKNGDQLGRKILKCYERYTDSLDTNKDDRKKLEGEIGGLLLDMKSVIANDEKTRQLMDQVDEGKYVLESQVPIDT